MTSHSLSLTPHYQTRPIPDNAVADHPDNGVATRATAGDTQHIMQVPSALTEGKGKTLPAGEINRLLSEVKPDLDHCRDTLARNQSNADRFVRTQGSRVDSFKQVLAGMPGNVIGGDPSGHRPAARSMAPVEFDKGWQVQHKTASDKLSGVVAAAADLFAADIPATPARGMDDITGLRLAGEGKEFKSYRELWQDAVDGIGVIKAGYLEVYETVVERYTAFYSDFSDFMSGLTAYLDVTTDDKGNQTMEFKTEALNKINALINSYSSGSKGILFPASGTTTKAEAEKWAAELGLPAHCVTSVVGGFVVKMDISPLTTIRDNLRDIALKPMTTFQYQSWRSGFDAQSGKFQTTLQTLTTKYGNANGMFDTLVKVLSSSITSGAETLKQILASI